MNAFTLSQVLNSPEIYRFKCVAADGSEIIGIIADETSGSVKFITQSEEEEVTPDA